MSEKPSFKKDSIVPTEIGYSMPRYLDVETKRVRGEHHFDADPRAGRTLQEYLSVFGLEMNELRGKKILDLGAGRDVLPAQELTGIADVTSLSPDFGSEAHRSPLENEVPRVAALGDQLPFADNTFDMIWLFHVLDHVERREQKNTGQSARMEVIKEAVRVLKPGGVVYVAPTTYGLSKYEVTNALQKLDVEIKVEDTGFWAILTDYDFNYDYEVGIDRMKITKN